MSKADLIYMPIAYEILNDGVFHKVDGAYYEDGAEVFVKKAKRRIVMEFDLEEEFPILTSKFTAWQLAKSEMFWFWIMQSNDVNALNSMNNNVWDEWKGIDNTIGKAYGYQIKKHKMLDKLISTLKYNPNDRGMVFSLWDHNDLPEMNIRPCALMTMWDVTDGKLNCTLIQRSGDWGLGIPFNFTQYAMLLSMVAQVTNLKPGKLTHVINNAHIYNRHVDSFKELFTRNIYSAPKLYLNSKVNNIYDFELNDVSLTNYVHDGRLPMEVAIVTNPLKPQ